MSLDREVIQERGAKPVIGGLLEAAENALKGSGLSVKLTGAPVMQLEIRNAVERDRLVYNGLGFLVGALIAFLFFRRLSLTLIAVLGPFAVGALHDASDGWTVPLLVLLALCIPQYVVGLLASRPGYIEDELH